MFQRHTNPNMSNNNNSNINSGFIVSPCKWLHVRSSTSLRKKTLMHESLYSHFVINYIINQTPFEQPGQHCTLPCIYSSFSLNMTCVPYSNVNTKLCTFKLCTMLMDVLGGALNVLWFFQLKWVGQL